MPLWKYPLMVILICVHLSPSPVGREYEIRTTDIIGSDCEGSQPPGEHCYTNNEESQKSSTELSSLPQTAKDTQLHTSTQSQTEIHKNCTAPTDPSPTTPQQQNSGTDLPSASSCGSVTPTTSNHGHSQSPLSPSYALLKPDTKPQPGPLTLQTPHSSEAAEAPSTVAQTVSQHQSQTPVEAAASAGPIRAQVNGSSPAREAHPEAPRPTNTSNPQAPVSPSLVSPLSPQPAASSSTDGSPVFDEPVPGFATLGRRLMLTGSDSHYPNPIQQHPHNHYPATEHSAAPDTNKKHCSSTQTPQLHPPSCSNYSTVSIPLPHPQPPLPEKRHMPAQSGSPGEVLGALRPAMGYVPPSATSSTQQQHHVTFSPTVGEIAPSAGQIDEVATLEPGNANRVSVKFVQDSSRFWYKSAITREQGGSGRINLFVSFSQLQHF